MKYRTANRMAPDGTPHSATSHLGLFCFPKSHKKDARLICVKRSISLVYSDFITKYSNFLLIEFEKLFKPQTFF